MFDPESRTWMQLPNMQHRRRGLGVVAVAGGMVALGGTRDDSDHMSSWDHIDDDDDYDDFGPDELYDEESGRWFALPHPMAEPRTTTTAVALPAAALAPVATAAGAAATAE